MKVVDYIDLIKPLQQMDCEKHGRIWEELKKIVLEKNVRFENGKEKRSS